MVVISVMIKAHFRLPSVPQKRRLLKPPIIARHVLGSSHAIIAIVILTGCHIVTLSSRFRGELQNVTKEPGKLLQIPSWISTTRKVQYWQVHFLNVNILPLKICM